MRLMYLSGNQWGIIRSSGDEIDYIGYVKFQNGLLSSIQLNTLLGKDDMESLGKLLINLSEKKGF